MLEGWAEELGLLRTSFIPFLLSLTPPREHQSLVQELMSSLAFCRRARKDVIPVSSAALPEVISLDHSSVRGFSSLVK